MNREHAILNASIFRFGPVTMDAQTGEVLTHTGSIPHYTEVTHIGATRVKVQIPPEGKRKRLECHLHTLNARGFHRIKKQWLKEPIEMVDKSTPAVGVGVKVKFEQGPCVSAAKFYCRGKRCVAARDEAEWKHMKQIVAQRKEKQQ